MSESDADLLAGLRTHLGWTRELQRLAEEAVKLGKFREAYDFATAQRWGGAQPSSNSSVAFIVREGPAEVTVNPSFCDLLHGALLDVLGQR